jgi:hypothetical protein
MPIIGVWRIKPRWSVSLLGSYADFTDEIFIGLHVSNPHSAQNLQALHIKIAMIVL